MSWLNTNEGIDDSLEDHIVTVWTDSLQGLVEDWVENID